MKKNKKSYVSILIAVYNEKEIIEEKLLSIINSNYPHENIEIIIGSDCSTDATNDIIRNLANKYSFIKVIIFNKRLGKAAVVNELIKRSRYNFLILTIKYKFFTDLYPYKEDHLNFAFF